jgi:hypothetical protein
MIVNGVGVQVKSALLGATPPTGYYLKSSDYVVLRVDFAFDKESDKLKYKDFFIVDETGYESRFELISFEFSASNESSSKITIYYAVKPNAHQFSLHLSGGQVIDLTPILAFK